MKKLEVTVPWEAGLHLRPAAALVQIAKDKQSEVTVRSGAKIANLRNIMSVLMLCASMGTTLTIETSGDDEQQVIQEIEAVFSAEDSMF
jgi:phosphotransferase system HPr (HPr) family protein